MAESESDCIACRGGRVWSDAPAKEMGPDGVAFVIVIVLAEVRIARGKVRLCREHEEDLEKAVSTLESGTNVFFCQSSGAA